MVLRGFVWSLAVLALLALPDRALAAFHLIEIEQVIGGVDGDATAQAIQLRFRSAGQNLLNGAVRLRAHDAAGLNPVLLLNFTGANPASGAICRRVLVATSQMEFKTTPPLTAAAADYTMTAPIPESYLAAGSLTFENTAGTQIYWRISWGGAAYTGPAANNVTTLAAGGNDPDGTMSPPFGGVLPSAGDQALRILTGCNPTPAPTNNELQYGYTNSTATFMANDLTEYSLGPAVPVFPGSAGLALVGGLGAVVLGGAILRRRLGAS